MATYIVVKGDELKTVEQRDLLADDMVIAEVIEGGDDPLIALKNQLASPTDFLWPDNMFSGQKVRLSTLPSP